MILPDTLPPLLVLTPNIIRMPNLDRGGEGELRRSCFMKRLVSYPRLFPTHQLILHTHTHKHTVFFIFTDCIMELECGWCSIYINNIGGVLHL